VFKLRSVNSIVIAPANTGKDNNRRIAVTKTDHGNKGIRSKCIPKGRKLKMVTMKLIAPIIEEAPAKWRLKMAKSTAGPE
jgi:hypothetical protein